MKIDLDRLRELAKKDIEEANNRSNKNNSQYKLLYPGKNGKITVKLLYNDKARLVQRKIYRHGKVPCFSMYGEGCPICDAIAAADTVNSGNAARSKYGYKVRGICYAQVVDGDNIYFSDDNDPEKGDVVVLMYPKTVFESISNIINDSGDSLLDIVGSNEGLAITIDRSQKSGSAPSYSTYVYPYGKFTSFKDEGNTRGEDKYMELLESLPDLNETIVPKYPSEEVREAVRAMSETITSEYMSGVVLNPNKDDKEHAPDRKAENISNMVNTTPDNVVGNKTADNTGKPPCYGNHSNDPSDHKCLVCEFEDDCYIDSTEQM